MLLSSCGTTKIPFLTQTPQIQITKEQFDCGPKAKPLPSNEELVQMTDRDLFNSYAEAWKWGQRCDSVNQENYNYLIKSLKIRQSTDLPKK